MRYWWVNQNQTYRQETRVVISGRRKVRILRRHRFSVRLSMSEYNPIEFVQSFIEKVPADELGLRTYGTARVDKIRNTGATFDRPASVQLEVEPPTVNSGDSLTCFALYLVWRKRGRF